MYIEVTVDLKHYTGDTLDLRLSNYHSIKKVIDIVWQTKRIYVYPREGYWIRVANKQAVYFSGCNIKVCLRHICSGTLPIFT